MAGGVRAALVVLVVTEAALAFVPENTMIRTFRWMKDRIVRQAAPAVQLHGDSVAQGGLFASDIAAHLPADRTVFNAALQGSGPEFTYYLLQRQVRAGRTPGAIVLAHSPHTYVTQRVSILTGAFLDWRDVPDALSSSGAFFDALYGVLCRLSFTLRHRDELADLVKGRTAALATWHDPVPDEARSIASLAQEQQRLEADGPKPLPPLHPVYRNRFAPDAGQVRYLARTLALARARRVTVYWWTMPEHPQVAAARDSLGFPRDYARFVDSLASRGEIVVLRRDPPVWSAGDFSDYTHLRLPAARRVSAELGEALARHDAGPAAASR